MCVRAGKPAHKVVKCIVYLGRGCVEEQEEEEEVRLKATRLVMGDGG